LERLAPRNRAASGDRAPQRCSQGHTRSRVARGRHPRVVRVSTLGTCEAARARILRRVMTAVVDRERDSHRASTCR
jgi:hypothetical protein